jgi:5-methylcytosine-specific restriction endonuclease McrA
MSILKRDKFICRYCGKKITMENGSIDHRIPKSRGGKNTRDNMIASCKKCNHEKADSIGVWFPIIGKIR